MSKKKQIIFSSLLGIVLLVVIFMPKKETTEPLDEIEAVSYTHLDVYKRQKLLRIRCNVPILRFTEYVRLRASC